MAKKRAWLLWSGGIIFLVLFGALRFIGKGTGTIGLVTAMAVAIFFLAYFVLRYVNKNW